MSKLYISNLCSDIKNQKKFLNIVSKFEDINGLDIAPKKVKIRFKNYPKKYPQTEPLRRCPDISRLVKEFKFKQFTKIEDSIMNFYKWSQRYY